MALSVIDVRNPTQVSYNIDWAAVQLVQFEHDEKYHREICRLSTQDRLRHMSLHFAKYAGRLLDDPSDADFRQIAVDTMVIAVSCANILNVDLPLTFAPTAGKLTRSEYTRRLTIAAGKMAAACEKLDHLEDFPFRQILTAQALVILAESVALFQAEDWGPVQEMSERLAKIKTKSIFHGKM